jgi:hypothetical protein
MINMYMYDTYLYKITGRLVGEKAVEIFVHCDFQKPQSNLKPLFKTTSFLKFQCLLFFCESILTLGPYSSSIICKEPVISETGITFH